MKKLYDVKLGRHSEQWTQEEHDAVKAAVGVKFSEYEITPIQPDKPADVQTPAKTKAKDADNPAA